MIEAVIYDTEFRCWMKHANLNAESFCDLTGADPKLVVDWATGTRRVPKWAIAFCQSVSDNMDEPDLEPHEILGLQANQTEDFHLEAAVEAILDRYGPSLKLDVAVADWLSIRAPAEPIPPSEWWKTG